MQPLNANTLEKSKVAEVVGADDLSREVYGIAGLPVDAVTMATTLRRIDDAADSATPFLISTANVNFLITSKSDEQFRESVLLSDLCTADGMPIVWIARLFGIPINTRIAGSDLFEALKSEQRPPRRLKIFLFGGAYGAAEAACKKLNSEPGGLFCAGWYDPGYCDIDDMSTDAILDTINSSNADFLAVALGAKKGQEWLLKNHDRIRIPVRVHLGATINFQAGALKRAPKSIQKLGFEWLWRIVQEPKLWKTRYRDDGIALFRLLVTQIVPHFVLERWCRRGLTGPARDLVVTHTEDRKAVVLSLIGAATAENLNRALPDFQRAAAADKPVIINLARAGLIDARFLGLFLMLNKRLKRQGLHLEFSEVTPRIKRIFRLSGFAYLLRN